MASAIDASNAYIGTMKQLQGAGAASNAGGALQAGGPSFMDLLKSGADSAIGAQHTSEKTSAAAVMGKANMSDVLSAVNNAELALNTVLAVRDRLVQAYDNVLRTPI